MRRESIFRAHNVWWRCAQYFVNAFCGYMPRDNRCVYIAHVCFYVCCSDCVGVCGNVCCLASLLKVVVFSLGVLKYVVCLCRVCGGCCVFCLYCEAWCSRCSCIGSVEFRHADVVCLCLVVILRQFSMLRSAWLTVC